jgi:hypothetical protein
MAILNFGLTPPLATPFGRIVEVISTSGHNANERVISGRVSRKLAGKERSTMQP